MTAQRPSRKGEIVELAAELIAERGYDGMSLRDIADSMQISKGTVVHHFRSKEQLLERVHAAYMTKRLAEAEVISAAFDTPSARLAGFIYQLMIVQVRDRAATVAFAREISRFASDDVMDDVRLMRTRYSELIKGVVRDGMDQGEFKPGDPNMVAMMIFGMCNWSWTWLKPRGRLSPDEIAEAFAGTLLFGLASNNAGRFDPHETARIVKETIATIAESPTA